MKTSPNNHGNFLMPSIMLSKARADGFSWESLPSSTATGNITSQSRLLMHLPTNMLTKLSSIEDVSSQKMVTKTKRLQMMILPDERLCYSMTWPWKPTIEGIYGTGSGGGGGGGGGGPGRRRGARGRARGRPPGGGSH